MSKLGRVTSVVLATSVAVTGALVGVQPGVAFAASPAVASVSTVETEIVIQVPPAPLTPVHLSVVIPAGEVFSVALYENASTGYTWVRSATGDSGPIVTYLDSSYVQDPAPPNMVGVGGTLYLRYQAGSVGSTVIGMNYQRAWESTPLQQVTIDVQVE